MMVLSYILLGLAGSVFLGFNFLLIRFLFRNRKNIPDCSLIEARERYEKNRKEFRNLVVGGSIGLIAGWFIFESALPLYQFLLIFACLAIFLVLGSVYYYQAMLLAKQRIQQLDFSAQEERHDV